MQIREVVVTGQNAVELQTRELDEKELGPDELLIETEATFISAGTELANYTGREPRVFQPNQWCTYPWRSGYANVGVVRGIPSIAVGRSRGGNGHTLQEWSDIESAKIGTKQIILLTGALAGLQ